MSIQPPQLRIRVSDKALKELDEAARRNDRSRNAEASSRIEASLVGESPYPEDMALLNFVNATAAQIGGIVGVLGPEGRGGALTMLKGALNAVLDELGASESPDNELLGKAAGKRIVEEARRAASKPVKELSPENQMLAFAANVWGLNKKGEGE